jgi:hypothetical protein
VSINFRFDPISSRLAETYPFDIDEVPPETLNPSGTDVAPPT